MKIFKFFTYIAMITTLAFGFSCSPKSGGFAPVPVTNSPGGTTPINSNNLKVVYSHSQSVKTSNGWAIDADFVSPVKTKTLANGWQVEVRYE